MEEWKIVESFPDYEVSNLGNIRKIRTKKPKYCTISAQGYRETQFKNCGEIFTVKLHRLVASAFLDEPPLELVDHCAKNYPYVVCVNHKDGDKLNNRPENLEWCTHAENSKHAWKTGLTHALKGELNGMAVLTEALVHELCSFYEQGGSPTQAIEKFGISRSQATKIRSGHAWRHVWIQYNIQPMKKRKV